MSKKTFTVKPKHLKLLQNLYFTSYDEYGTACVDSKRPFGDSNVEQSMLEILGIIEPKKWYDLDDDKRRLLCDVCELDKTFKELHVCLQILVRNLTIEVGTYEASEYDTDWKKVGTNK